MGYYGRSFSPKQTEYGDGDGEGDERERVSGCIHGLHVGEIQMSIWWLNKEKRTSSSVYHLYDSTNRFDNIVYHLQLLNG